jgi:hypothetical protein
MKKQIILSFLLTFFGLVASVKAQSILLSPPGKGVIIDGGCVGMGGLCNSSMIILNNRSAEEGTNFAVFQSANNRVIIKYPKALLDEDMKLLFLSRDAYFLEIPQTLDNSIKEALHKEKNIVLAQGWHPIIEWEDSYFISFSIIEK